VSLPSEPRRLWVDLRELLPLNRPIDILANYHDHGIGLLRTILHAHGVQTDIISTGNSVLWFDVQRQLAGYDMILMNIRSYTWALAYRVAKIFKEMNPKGLVLVGGMHASVSLDDLVAVPEIDKICCGPGENVIVDLVRHPERFPRVIQGTPSASMADWPAIDRTLFPKPPANRQNLNPYWPLEPGVWHPSPTASIITSRVCPWRCAFCNEHSYIPNMGRRPVEMVIDELNFLDRRFGPLGSVAIHDSMFFQNRPWLEQWIEQYPRKAHHLWPYWAGARADVVCKWPDLFEALVRQTNWNAVSIGFESGSNRTLQTLNKECTEEQNYFVIDLLNRIGDDMEKRGMTPPYFWNNIIFGVPGETREDAMRTARMIKEIKRQRLSPAFYAPYRGSVLGYQLTAEGKNLMNRDEHDRYPNKKRVKDVDYQFFNDLLAGKYAHQIDLVQRPAPTPNAPSATPPPGANRHQFFVFTLKNGKKRIGWGTSPEDALKIMGYRLTEEELNEILPSDPIRISQTQVPDYIDQLA
jgi:anaerobic magnesium-protoporphyrin IX monomethyl ester cyclase